jgi:hypothetical protein
MNRGGCAGRRPLVGTGLSEGRGAEAEGGCSVANERSAREALGDDASDVVDGRGLHEANGLARESLAYHGVSGSHPSGGYLEALASLCGPIGPKECPGRFPWPRQPNMTYIKALEHTF